MLTNVQRTLAGVKVNLLREARDLPQAYVDSANIAIAHLNDAAEIIQAICAQVEPETASMDAERIAEREELEKLRAQVAAQEDAAPRAEPDPPFEPPEPGPLTAPGPVKDMIPIADPEHDTSPLGDPADVAADQARALGRMSHEHAREGDPPEQGWG